jgi:ligand-binding SRPBCC domain-containing protein
MPVDRFETVIDAPPERVFEWHEQPGAFERLSPPWAEVRVVEREGGIRDGARVVLDVRKGPVHMTGEIRHRGY